MRTRARIALIAATACCGACASLVDVDNPGLIDAGKLNPIGDGRTFSLSARQNFASTLGVFIVNGAWFTGEGWVSDAFQGLTDFDRRDVGPDNGQLASLWSSISIARESNERVVAGLTGSSGDNVNIDLARSALFAGYSYEVMAESFCEGAVDGGPLLDTSELLRRGIEYFTRAQTVSAQIMTGGAAGDRAEAQDIQSAALVGRARAKLQAGDGTGAQADAASVPSSFSYSLLYSDNASTVGRLGNGVAGSTIIRASLSIAPAFRNLGDPRVPVGTPSASLQPADGVTEFWPQRKYLTSAAPIRLASGLEASYIAAEAQGLTSMLALVQARRAANGQPAYTGATDNASVTREFMSQRSREFFLEGQRFGDTRRQPGLVPGVPQSGDAYHKTGFAPIGNQTCWTLPTKETSRFSNP